MIMRDCIDRCGFNGRHYFKCNYCGEKHCSEHRLPEKHDCVALSTANTLGPEFRDYINKSRNIALEADLKDLIEEGDADEPEASPKDQKERANNRLSDGESTADTEDQTDSVKAECKNCSSFAPIDYDLCIDCRRKGQLIDSRSPDVAVDGSIVQSEQNTDENRPEPAGQAILQKVKPLFSKPISAFQRAYHRTSLWNAIIAVTVIVVTTSLLFGIGPAAQFADEVNDAATGATNTSIDSEERTGAAESENAEDTAVEPEESSASGPEQSNDDPSGPSNLDKNEIESTTHELINEERLDAGESRLSYDNDLAKIARAHSQDMAERDFFSHTSPDGEGVDDRYKNYGYTCRIDLDGNWYIDGGGENIAQTWHGKQVITGSGSNIYQSEEELAEGLVQQWMNSPGHRENLLEPYWENQGIGVYVTDEGKVFATQNFC